MCRMYMLHSARLNKSLYCLSFFLLVYISFLRPRRERFLRLTLIYKISKYKYNIINLNSLNGQVNWTLNWYIVIFYRYSTFFSKVRINPAKISPIVLGWWPRPKWDIYIFIRCFCIEKNPSPPFTLYNPYNTITQFILMSSKLS